MSDWIGSVTGRVADFTIGTAIVVVHLMLANRSSQVKPSRKSNFLLPITRN